jgi:hypothetical protein
MRLLVLSWRRACSCVPTLQAAHLLTQAANSLCRARLSGYDACVREAGVPVAAPLRLMQLAVPGGEGYPWQQLIAEQASALGRGPGSSRTRAPCECRQQNGFYLSWSAHLLPLQTFAVFLARLSAGRLGVVEPADRDVLDACAQQLAQVTLHRAGQWAMASLLVITCHAAGILPLYRCRALPAVQVLVGFLVQQGPNGEVPRLADVLLARLLREFPALHYKRGVLAAMFDAAHQEDAAPVGLDGLRAHAGTAWRPCQCCRVRHRGLQHAHRGGSPSCRRGAPPARGWRTRG